MKMEQKQICCDEKLCARFISQNLESDTQCFYNVHNSRYDYECAIDELHGRRIWATFYGWVILSNHPESILWSLWNPITSKLITLPPLTRKETNDSYECCLSSPPDDDQGSIFLLFSETNPRIVFCRQRKWSELSYAKQLQSLRDEDEDEDENEDEDEDDCLLCNPTCCNGKIYALAWGRYYKFVIQVDIIVGKGNQVVISLLPLVKHPRTFWKPFCLRNTSHIGHSFLKGSCTDLFYVAVDFEDETICDVHLFKLDMTSMMWKAMVDLENAIFFVQLDEDYSICYYSSAVNDSELLGGYIHIFCDSGKTLYSFHVKDRTMSISSLVQEERQPSSTWAMLEWRLEVDHEKEDYNDIETVIKKGGGDMTSTTVECESHLLNLPSHILELIMELCVGVEYMKFRATCKHCYLAAPLIQWSSKNKTVRSLHSYSLVSPWLMVMDNYREYTITFIDPIFGERYFIKTPQELNDDGYQIYCSRYGWLLMCKTKGGPRLVFFNPFTSNILELPFAPNVESFCFSAPPTSPDCIVAGFKSYGPWNVYIHFVSDHEPTWREYGLNFGSDDPYSYVFPAFNGRDVYAMGNNNQRIDAFRDVADGGDDYSWELVADKGATSGCRSPAQYFLSNCEQHLLLVIVGEFGESVEVFNLLNQEWEKIDGLGNHMIYISDTSCICLEAKIPQMGNKIYFPRLFDTKIVFYSLETHMYHTFDDDKNVQESFGVDLFGTKYHCCPHTWIEPSWS